MTQDDIIRMAREAGFSIDGNSWIHAGAVLVDGRKSIDEHLKRFAALVAAHKAEVALAEAYRCGVEAGAAAERKPLTDEQVKELLLIAPVYAPDGVITRTPFAYRKELLDTALWALRKAEAAHNIGAKP